MRKNKTYRLVFFFLICFFLCGCFPIKPTYTKENLTKSITALGKKDYKLSIDSWLIGNTVWVRIPVSGLFDEKEQLKPQVMGDLNKTIQAATRVILSMNPRPLFLVAVASDIKETGMDCLFINYIPDIVKFQLQYLSRDEFYKRSIITIDQNAFSLGDESGSRLKKHDIGLGDFLNQLIMQRLRNELSEIYFEGKTWKIKIKTKEENNIIKILAYFCKEYDFNDFQIIEIENISSGEKSLVSKEDLKNFLR